MYYSKYDPQSDSFDPAREEEDRLEALADETPAPLRAASRWARAIALALTAQENS